MSNFWKYTFLFLCCHACAPQTEEGGEQAAPTNPNNFKSELVLSEVSLEPVVESIHLMGSVQTHPDKVWEYVSLVKGVVTEVHFSLGDAVQKGQVLAEVKSVELSHLQSQLETIEASIRAAKRNLEAVMSMHGDKLASDKDLAEAQSSLAAFTAEKHRIEKDLSMYGAHVSKGVFQIKSPATGIITSKSINAGMQLSDESGVLFTVANLDKLWVMANVYASNIPSIREGMKVAITTLSYPGEVFYGAITAIAPVMDEYEKVLKARIELDNINHKLKPGMVVDVNAFKDYNDTLATIPVRSIIFSDHKNYVLVSKGQDIELRKVVIAAQNDSNCYIAQGVSPGEKVIIKNQLLIFEQLKNHEN